MNTIKSMKAALMAMAVAVPVLGAGAAQAVDLRNEDEVRYTVKITSSTMSRELPVDGLTLSFIVCVGECTFEVEGLGTVSAKKDDVVTLKDGKLTATRGQSTASR